MPITPEEEHQLIQLAVSQKQISEAQAREKLRYFFLFVTRPDVSMKYFPDLNSRSNYGFLDIILDGPFFSTVIDLSIKIFSIRYGSLFLISYQFIACIDLFSLKEVQNWFSSTGYLGYVVSKVDLEILWSTLLSLHREKKRSVESIVHDLQEMDSLLGISISQKRVFVSCFELFCQLMLATSFSFADCGHALREVARAHPRGDIASSAEILRFKQVLKLAIHLVRSGLMRSQAREGGHVPEDRKDLEAILIMSTEKLRLLASEEMQGLISQGFMTVFDVSQLSNHHLKSITSKLPIIAPAEDGGVAAGEAEGVAAASAVVAEEGAVAVAVAAPEDGAAAVVAGGAEESIPALEAISLNLPLISLMGARTLTFEQWMRMNSIHLAAFQDAWFLGTLEIVDSATACFLNMPDHVIPVLLDRNLQTLLNRPLTAEEMQAISDFSVSKVALILDFNIIRLIQNQFCTLMTIWGLEEKRLQILATPGLFDLIDNSGGLLLTTLLGLPLEQIERLLSFDKAPFLKYMSRYGGPDELTIDQALELSPSYIFRFWMAYQGMRGAKPLPLLDREIETIFQPPAPGCAIS